MRVLTIRGENLASLGQPFSIDFDSEPLEESDEPESPDDLSPPDDSPAGRAGSSGQDSNAHVRPWRQR